ncbi:MAG: biopolymer transporter ExbD [Verrucomicrobiota bacterium]|nr:biopolymer transporter ExbD [Verrucomicrobiota bacterium]
MKLARTIHFNPGLFSLVPFITVLFLVLAFFTLSSAFVLQPGVSLSLPFSAFSLQPQGDPQIVSIATGPSTLVYFRDQKLSPDEFAAQLSSVPLKNRTLIVKADRAVPYEIVMRIANDGLKAGFSIVLATSIEGK